MEQQIDILKFGGSSLADFAAMSKCAAIVAKNPGHKVVVVSAIANTTRLLVSLAQQIPMQDKEVLLQELINRHYQIAAAVKNSIAVKAKLAVLIKRAEELINKLTLHKDSKLTAELLALGEQMSSLLFAAVLHDKGIAATNFDVKKVLKTNTNFVKAEPDIEKIKQCCHSHLLPICTDQVVVTQGFIGADSENNTTILGMESSDYTAALLAEGLGANHFAIWTDVAGVFTLDPKITNKAQPIAELSFREAEELAVFGAKILHPRTLQPAHRKNISLCVGCSQNPGTKTLISKNMAENTSSLRAMSLRKNQILLTIKNSTNIHMRDFLAKLFNVFAANGIDLDLVTSNNVSAAIVIDDSQEKVTQESLLTQELLQQLETFSQVEIERNLALIALVGSHMHKDLILKDSLFKFLQTNNVRSIFYGTSSHSICFLLASAIAKDIVVQLHDQLFIGNKT